MAEVQLVNRSRQIQAVTGRQQRPVLADLTRLAAPQAITNARFREEQRRLDIATKEQERQQQQQSTANVIEGGGTLAQGGFALQQSGLLSGTAAPTLAGTSPGAAALASQGLGAAETLAAGGAIPSATAAAVPVSGGAVGGAGATGGGVAGGAPAAAGVGGAVAGGAVAGGLGLAVGTAAGGLVRNRSGLEGNEATAAGAGTGALSGAAAGAVAGSVVPGIGTLAGGIIGGALGAAGGSGALEKVSVCVTASYGEDSREVGIIKRYRDKHLNESEMRGYYAIGRAVAYRMFKNKRYRSLIETVLIEPIVQTAAERLGEDYPLPSRLNRDIGDAFELLIGLIGAKIDEIGVSEEEDVQTPLTVETA